MYIQIYLTCEMETNPSSLLKSIIHSIFVWIADSLPEDLLPTWPQEKGATHAPLDKNMTK